MSLEKLQVINNHMTGNVVLTVGTVFSRHSFSDESSIGLLHSSIEERNVGKSLTLHLLAKGQGVGTHKHPTLLAGGNQNQCGASVMINDNKCQRVQAWVVKRYR